MLVFVPRPGVVLPPLPVSWPLSRPQARARALTKRYGSPIVVEPLLMRTTVERLTVPELAAIKSGGPSSTPSPDTTASHPAGRRPPPLPGETPRTAS
ncbi:hypothetical protein KV557_32100 [Kitasatospora aureofaciens]|uniref:hypothetical protein n=1 Tax=Kitasatospora aureofaciens TaxID=1894 RepID=UPI001C46701F|nr:hypothetical protein [Kitasatospora aureofaciens]MBV6701695.1 hypothetical protein [Kitasatospora aureofaciens]